MRIVMDRGGLYVILRSGRDDRDAIGFVIKPRRRKIFSERVHAWRGVAIGPLYFRTYKRRPGRDEQYDWHGIDARAVWREADKFGWRPLNLPRPKGDAA